MTKDLLVSIADASIADDTSNKSCDFIGAIPVLYSYKVTEFLIPQKENCVEMIVRHITQTMIIKSENMSLVAGILCGGVLSSLSHQQTKDGTNITLCTVGGFGVGVAVQLLLDKAMSQNSSVSISGFGAIAAGCALAAFAGKYIDRFGCKGYAGICVSSIISLIGASAFTKFFFGRKL